MTERGSTHPLDGTLIYGLLLLTALGAAPLARHFPLWIGGFFYAMIGLRLALQLRGSGPPNRWLTGGLVIVGCSIVLAIYHHPFGRDPGSALLLAMVGVKLLESKGRRDLYIAVFLGLFLVVVQSLFDQDLLVNFYLILISLALLALLINAHGAAKLLSARSTLRQLGLLLGPALPLAALLFLLFPRLSAPLWSLYTSTPGGTTGFSDRLRPGMVSQLSQSGEVAFRVSFAGEVPAQSKLYWRGLVFVDTDGKNWNLSAHPPLDAAAQQLLWEDEIVDYSLTLEPHFQRWLFALEFSALQPPDTRLNRAYELRTRRPVTKRTRFDLHAATRMMIDRLSERERTSALRLPDSITPRMRTLVDGWKQRSEGAETLVQIALGYFRAQPYYYSLTPPLVQDNPADQFLFETRSGYCEHYATSFTLLMRIAGIPSRVVTGYQGGEVNPHSGYLLVRQSDAHAWSEVWIEGSGWVRVDPTAAIAPERIQRPLDPDLLVEGIPLQFKGRAPSFLQDLARQARFVWDAVNTGWNDWVLNYNRAKQRSLLESLGLGLLRESGIAMLLVSACGAILALAAVWAAVRGRTRTDPVQRLYLRACGKLARRGLVRKPSEGAHDFALRASRARPDLAPHLAAITVLYLRLRYGTGGSAAEFRRLRRLVWRFRAGKTAAAKR